MIKPLPNFQKDIELVKKVRNGDQVAFRHLVERFQVQVNRTVIGMLGVCPEAEEVAQDVFIRFYKAIGQYQGEAQLGTYLTRIAINLSLNELKRRQRLQGRTRSLDQQAAKMIQLPDRSADPSRWETQEMIHVALQQLQPDFRTVVVLRLIEGYSVKDTASMLRLPMGTVASRLTRAQRKLKKLLHTLITS